LKPFPAAVAVAVAAAASVVDNVVDVVVYDHDASPVGDGATRRMPCACWQYKAMMRMFYVCCGIDHHASDQMGRETPLFSSCTAAAASACHKMFSIVAESQPLPWKARCLIF